MIYVVVFEMEFLFCLILNLVIPMISKLTLVDDTNLLIQPFYKTTNCLR